MIPQFFERLVTYKGCDFVLEVVRKQGLSALLLDELNCNSELSTTIKKTPNGMKQILQMIGITMEMEQQYICFVTVVKKLSEFSRSIGIPMMILKGYGLSLNYPIPAHRACGDIDIYTFGHQKEFDDAVAKILGISVNNHSAHHSTFQFEGFMVENHKTIMEPYGHKEHNDLNILLAEEAKMGLRKEDGIILPSYRFNSIHLLAHMANDFASTGTSLRRAFDWATFVYKATTESTGGVDWDYVFNITEKFGMLPFLNAINTVCSKYIGYTTELFPIRHSTKSWRHREVLDINASRVFEDLLKGPETILRPSQTNIFHYCQVKGARFFRNYWKYNMVYREPFILSLFRQISKVL